MSGELHNQTAEAAKDAEERLAADLIGTPLKPFARLASFAVNYITENA